MYFFVFFEYNSEKYLQKQKKYIILKKSSAYGYKYGACFSGGIGRRTGLKILRESNLVPVQVRPEAPFLFGEVPKSG